MPRDVTRARAQSDQPPSSVCTTNLNPFASKVAMCSIIMSSSPAVTSNGMGLQATRHDHNDHVQKQEERKHTAGRPTE